MNTVMCTLFILLEVLCRVNGGKEHVHFKIQVPEMIKHHTHTKTIYIHVHKMVPKKKNPPPKKHPEEEYHHEDWTSWSNYEHYDEHHDHEDDVHNIPDNENHYRGYPIHDYSEDSYHPGEMMGYSYPPQLSMPHPVKEIPHNDVESYSEGYEEGYHKGLHSEMGGKYSDVFTKFHDSKQEEGNENSDGYGDEIYGKTDAGRYLITEDDVEYDQGGGGYESDKRRISAKIRIGK